MMAEASSLLCVYVTAPDEACARALAQKLVEGHLAACVNMVPKITSVYRWQGQVEESQEVLLLVKTTAARFEAVAACVKAMHPYDCPCVVAYPAALAEASFGAWVSEAVEEAV